MVMTVIMHDAVEKLGPAVAEAYRAHTLFDVLYADDTLILGLSPANAPISHKSWSRLAPHMVWLCTGTKLEQWQFAAKAQF